MAVACLCGRTCTYATVAAAVGCGGFIAYSSEPYQTDSPMWCPLLGVVGGLAVHTLLPPASWVRCLVHAQCHAAPCGVPRSGGARPAGCAAGWRRPVCCRLAHRVAGLTCACLGRRVGACCAPHVRVGYALGTLALRTRYVPMSWECGVPRRLAYIKAFAGMPLGIPPGRLMVVLVLGVFAAALLLGGVSNARLVPHILRPRRSLRD